MSQTRKLTCNYSPITYPLDLVSKLSVITNKANEQESGYVVGDSNKTKMLAVQLKPFLKRGKIYSCESTHCYACCKIIINRYIFDYDISRC